MLHNPSIETTKEMKRMLFLLKSLSSLLSSLTSSRVLFSLLLFSFARPSEIGFSSRLSYSTLLVVGFAFMPIPFLSGASSSLRAFSLSFSLSSSWKSCFFFFFFRRAREDDISSDGEESHPEVDFARDDDVLLR